jgi:plastocyanin
VSGRGWGLALGLTVLAAVAVVAPAGAASKTVEMEGQQYNPKRVEISADDTVVWEHQGEGSHTVTADNGSFDSSSSCSQLVQLDCMDKKGESFDHKFPGAGSFLYHCKVHGASGGQGMSGVVVVKAKAATPSTTAPPGSGTTATTRPGTVTTTTRAGVTTTSRPLSTSSTVIRSTTTTTGDAVFDVEPNEPPAFDPGDEGGGAAPAAKGSGKKGNSDTVAVIVALLLAVASAGGILLWRLRPGRS